MNLDNQELYAAWVGFIGAIGLVTALTRPLTGAAAVIGITLISLVIVMKDLNKIDRRLPSVGRRTWDEHMHSLRTAVLVIVSFIPFLFPEAVIAVGVIFLLVALLTYLEITTDIDIGIRGSIDNVIVLTMLGGAIIFSGVIEPILLIPPAVMFTWYVFTLLPMKTQRKINERLEE